MQVNEMKMYAWSPKMVRCIHGAGVNCHIYSYGFQLLFVGWREMQIPLHGLLTER